LRAGASLVQRTGYDIARLESKAIKDRLDLARAHLREASQASKAMPPAYRATISRSYYSMYHSVRAVCLFRHRGDDHEEHSKLPAAIPNDFPSRLFWENELKRARLDRNRADYDPYPRNSTRFSQSASDLLENATKLLSEVRAYLRSKGCMV